MQRLEVSGAVRPIYGSLGVKRLNKNILYLSIFFSVPGIISLSRNPQFIQNNVFYTTFVCENFPLSFNGLLLVFKVRH